MLIDFNNRWLMAGNLGFLQVAIADYYNDIPYLPHAGCRAVKADFARSLGCLDSVGDKPLAGVKIEDLHLLVRMDFGCPQEFFVNSDRALVVELGAGYCRPMDFRFQHC